MAENSIEPELLNPYAAPSEPKLEAIRFCGILTPEILIQSTRPVFGVETLARVIGWVWVATFVPWSAWHIYNGLITSARVYPIIWLLLGGTVLMAFWFPIVVFSNNRMGAAGRRVRRLSDPNRQYRGWIDDVGVTRWTDASAMRCRWQYFGSPVVLRDQIQIPDLLDERIKILLPWSFFESSDSYHAASNYLHDRVGGPEANRPDPNVAKKLFGDTHREFDFDSSAAEHWSADHWPPNGEFVEGKAFDLHLNQFPSPVSRFLDRARNTLVALVVVLLMLLPMLITIAAWIAYDYRHFGGWSFLLDNGLANSTVIVPYAAIVLFIAWMFWQQLRAQHRRSDVRITLNERGIHLGHADGDFWWNHSEIVEIKTDERKASFLTAAAIDALEIRESAFENQQAFHEFCRLLNRYAK